MTVPELIDLLTFDRIAVTFFFVLIPTMVLAAHRISGNSANESPYKYLYSILIYIAALLGVLSASFWVYSMLVESKSLWSLNFYVYYMPILSMLGVFWLVGMKARIAHLPWFGELSELLLLIGVAFASMLLILHFGWIPFEHLWQIVGATVVLFGVFKLGWERFNLLRH